MDHLPLTLYTNAQIRALEQAAIVDHQIPAYTLMQKAGEAAFKVLQQRWPKARKIAIICGRGNNGGDGYVLARLAKAAKLQVSVYHVDALTTLQDPALASLHDCQAAGVAILPFDLDIDFNVYDLIVDALLGTGLSGTVTPAKQDIIKAINQAKPPIFALDCPSGLNVDTGCALGACVNADATITFIGLKQGLFTASAPNYCGEIFCDDLAIPSSLYQQTPSYVTRLSLPELKQTLLPARKRSAHKGDFGHVLIVGGDYGMAGAASMAALAAARVGAGLVSVATQPEHVAIITTFRPEIMAHAVTTAAELAPLLAKATVVAIGPGLGQTAWSKTLLETALVSKLPLVMDADALNLLATQPCQRDQWVLTPHPGEAARLLNEKTATIQQGRFNAIQQLQQQYHGTIVLKGAGSLIIDTQQRISLAPAGNPGMASGGMGDVLSGLIAGLIAQKLDLAAAAQLGVMLHAVAADLAAKQGERGILATDLLPYVRELVN